ncbi:hypothetical protein QBC40DRAFT_330218, partial [Triangularia verruculosa]
MILPKNETGSDSDGTSPATPANAVGLVFGSLAVVCLIVLLSMWLSGSQTTQRDSEAGSSFQVENLNRVSPPVIYRDWKLGTQKGECRFLWSTTSLICVICLEPPQSSSTVRCLPCGHLFHSICILMWFLRHHSTCPICKSNYMSV